jgi:hypothetical protein
MSADEEPKALSKREMKKLTDEAEFWLKQSREAKQHQYGVMAAGVAAGIKIAKDRLEE